MLVLVVGLWAKKKIELKIFMISKLFTKHINTIETKNNIQITLQHDRSHRLFVNPMAR